MLTSAHAPDLPEAVALINASYRGESSRRGWAREDYIGGDRTSVAELEADFARTPGARLLLHRDDPSGPLLGCVWIEPHDGDLWYLGLLTVRPDLQARQLGRSILAEAEAHIREAGGKTVRMTVVHLRDTLIAWYERRGYAFTGETEPFPYGDPPRTDLHFVVLEKAL